jgi:hypothetical protein
VRSERWADRGRIIERRIVERDNRDKENKRRGNRKGNKYIEG